MGICDAGGSDPFNDRAHQLVLAQMRQLNRIGGLTNGTLGQAAAAAYGYPNTTPGSGHVGAGFPSPAQQGPIAPAEPLEDAGIRAGEIIGWRCWRLKNGLLQSMAMGTIWAPGEPMEGKPGDHDVAGVNAFRTQSGALTYAMDCLGNTVVVGQIEMWGKVVEHELGYRSEYAQIVSLCRLLGDENRKVWEAIQERDRMRAAMYRPGLLDLLLRRPAPTLPSVPAPFPTPEERLAQLRREYGLTNDADCGEGTKAA